MSEIPRFSDEETRLMPSDTGYYVLYADHLKELEGLREVSKGWLKADGPSGWIDDLRADASWAATHRSELADLRDAFAKAEAQLREKDAALNHATYMDDKHQEESRQLLRSKDEQLAGMREWNSVKERLPDELSLVLVCFEDRTRLLGRRDEWGEWETEDEEALIGVTHWQPLPEPPALSGLSPAQEGTCEKS